MTAAKQRKQRDVQVTMRRRIENGTAAPDGLSWPRVELQPNQVLARRALLGHRWAGNISLMAQDLGVASSTVSFWVSGRNHCSDRAIQQIATALGVTADDLRSEGPARVWIEGRQIDSSHAKYDELVSIARILAPELEPDPDSAPVLAPSCHTSPKPEA